MLQGDVAYGILSVAVCHSAEIFAYLSLDLFLHVGCVLDDGHELVVESIGSHVLNDLQALSVFLAVVVRSHCLILFRTVAIVVVGDGEDESRAPFGVDTLVDERAVVDFGHVVGRVESDAHAVVRDIAAHVGVEDALLLVGTEPRSVVFHGDNEQMCVVVLSDGKGHIAFLRRVFHGVGEQVVDDGLYSLRVKGYGERLGKRREIIVQVLLRCHAP